MKKIIFLLFMCCNLSAMAQIRFGFLSYQKVAEMLPEYKTAITNMSALKEKYNQEAQRTEDELMKKYAEFIQGQADFPQNILQKRQNEMQSLIKSGISFREESEKLLKEAEKEMQQNITLKLNQAIEQVGKEKGLAFVLNTDNNTCPFINLALGEDITQQVLIKLGVIKITPQPEILPTIISTNDTISMEQEFQNDSTRHQGQQIIENIDSTLTDHLNIPDSTLVQ